MTGRAALAALLAATAACGARTALNDQAWEPAALYCSDALLAGRPGRDLALVAGVPRALRGRARWAVVASPPGSTATVQSDGGERATFRADREGAYTVRVSAEAPADGDAGDAGPAAELSCELTVQIRAAGPVAACPAELTVAPLQPVTLLGRSAGDRPVRSVAWSVDGAPAGSARRPPEPTDAATTRFTPDIAGDHRLRFRVVDDDGASDECVTVVHAVPREGLRVELSWDPPGRSCPDRPGAACDDSDVDLHLLRGGGSPVWGSGGNRSESDCYFANCTAGGLRWGDPASTDDDPRLDIDDVTGHGPENINILRPSAPYYRVGVHYYASDGAGPQAATLTIYCNGPTPVARLGPVTVTARTTPEANDLWIAADIVPLAGGGCRVAPIARGGQPWIATISEAMRSPAPPAP
ncbi:MAG: hypothetical protein Q7V43_26060 [Myxococcales bacterium]|nr:hypothetical protein [Myxococcales bacterium]